jgi:hypothetical protein
MKSRCGYKGYVIEVRSYEIRGGGFSAEFSIEEHGGAGVTETQFYLPNTFSTQEVAIQAAIQAARQKYRYGLRAGIGRSELSRIEPQTMRRISR